MRKVFYIFMSGLLILLIGFTPMFSSGQDTIPAEKKTRAEKRKDFDRYGYIGANIGANLNHTDISDMLFAPTPDQWHLGYGIHGGWQFAPIWGARLHLGNGTVGGYFEDDKGLTEASGYRAINFRTSETSLEAHLTINFSNLISGYKARLVDIYGFTGLGQVQWKSTSWDSDSGTEWNNNGNGNDVPVVDGVGSSGGLFSDRTRAFMLPAGVGVFFHVAPKWDINAEIKLNFVDTDRFDTWNKNESMPVYADMFSYNNIGVTYKFGKEDPLKGMEEDYATVKFVAEPDPLEAHGGEVPVKITGTFPPEYFHPEAAMYFAPVLVCEDGKEFPLDPVVLKGQDVAGEGILIPEGGGSFTYYDTVEYADCQRASELRVNPVIFVPEEPLPENVTPDMITGLDNRTLPQTKLADGVITTPTRYAPSTVTLVAPHGYEKETIISKDARIYYYVNRHDLNWGVPLNKDAANKQKLQDLQDFIRVGYKIKNITIDGWASPEGEETFNEGLSENRSKTANKYLIDQIKKMAKEKDTKVNFKDPANEITWNLAHHGPDWNGFLYKVQNSNIKDKNMILNVINSAGTPAKKEQEIRNMIVIYPELEDQILTTLRRAEIVVNCFEPKKTDEEIAALAISDPKTLTEKELLYSATLTTDDNQKLQIYKSAIQNYPNSATGYINAASIEIKKGDLAAAKAHLEKAVSLDPNNGEAFFNLGLVYALEGDNAKAEENFKKAQQLGEDVNYNMGVIAIENGDYSKALSLFGNKTCDYNVALAQVLTKNYVDAEKNLNCAPKDAATYYLTAIVGSRTDNTTLLFDNLGKAIQADPKYKGYAATDREFIKYFNDPNFQALVK